MGCALDQDNVIDPDKTHDEAMTGDDDEPLFCLHLMMMLKTNPVLDLCRDGRVLLFW